MPKVWSKKRKPQQAPPGSSRRKDAGSGIPTDPAELMQMALADHGGSAQDLGGGQLIVEFPPSDVLPGGHRLRITCAPVDLDEWLRDHCRKWDLPIEHYLPGDSGGSG